MLVASYPRTGSVTITGRVRWPDLVGPPATSPNMKLAQRSQVERAMLHFIDDEIVMSLGELQANVIAVAALGAGIIDRLPVRQKFDCFIEALGLVIRVATLRPHR